MQDAISEFLSRRVIAVVGASDRRDKYGYKVFRSLKSRGYTVYPIHPRLDQIDGVRVYRSLGEVPERIEAVDCVVPPEVTERVVEDCHRLGIKLVWLQPGAESAAAVAFCERNGITCIHDTCVIETVNER